MACPYFMPTERLGGLLWPHSPRLPLGDGWKGHCTAPGYEGDLPSDDELKDGCNLGYARACPRLPRERACDAVRFSIARDHGQRITLFYVCEIEYRPGEHGALEFDTGTGGWSVSHRDPALQRMAQCYMESYLRRKLGGEKATDES